MISTLTVKVEAKLNDTLSVDTTLTFDALDVLGLMQQALPGSKKPNTGIGTLASPWEPKTPNEWFYCAKVAAIAQRQLLKLTKLLKQESATRKAEATQAFTGSGEARKAWLKVGGRRIRLLASNLYSSDCGKANVVLASNTLPGLVYEDASYPTILSKLTTWIQTGNQDADVTARMRSVLKGEAWKNAPDVLPLLTNVLFVSEVARNHTAFHSVLMMLDLLDASAVVDSPLAALPTGTLTWKKALWSNEGQVTCPNCGGTRQVQVVCNRCTLGWKDLGTCKTCGGAGCATRSRGRNPNCRQGKHTGKCHTCDGTARVMLNCNFCKQTGLTTRSERVSPLGLNVNTAKGGVEQLQGGLLPMSHTGSAQGSAYDLARGAPTTASFAMARVMPPLSTRCTCSPSRGARRRRSR